MSSIPLPALDVRSQQPQPELLSQYAQLQALRNQQVMQPLQQQAAQNQAQSSGIDLQMKQQQLKDQQAMSATMQQWGKPQSASQPASSSSAPSSSSMPSYDELVPLAIKNGASFQAVQGLQAHVLDMKAKAATIAMDDARTGASNAETIKTKNGIIVDAMSGVMNAPDAQLPQAIQATAQHLGDAGLFDPPHMQMAQQLAQLALTNPSQARQQLALQANSMGAFSKSLDDSKKQVDLLQAQGKSDPNSPFYAPSAASIALGTAPGSAQINQGEANAAAMKAGAEAQATEASKIRIAEHSPFAMVMGNQLGGAQNSNALDFAAENYRQTGQMPPGLTRSPGSTVAIIQRAAQLDQQQGGQGVAMNKASYNANVTSLKSLQKNYDQVQAFEGTAQKNMDLLAQTAKNIPDLGTRFANVPVRMLSSQMLGTENMAKFHTALYAAQTEAAKVLNSANATGVLSDSARHELQSIIDGNAPLPAILGSLNTLKQEFGNRTQSYQAQIGDIQSRIKNTGTAAQTAPGTAPAKANDPFAQFGGVAH